ncbi:MAG: hypothetical protein JNG85_17670 [Spirochaetaceae bacterium]|nr:hypothetical protein [Spirochaetaceae bacterium]
MEIRLFRLKLPLKNGFRIAHGSYSFRENLFLELREGKAVAWGEAPIVPYYHLTIDEVEADLRRGLAALSDGVSFPLEGKSAPEFAHPVSRAAFGAALLSLRARLEGKTEAELLGLGSGAEAASAPPTSFTVAYDDDPEAMAAVAASCGFRRLKVKAGIPGDIERIRLLRERLPEAIIRVDANQGWSPAEAPGKLRELERLGIELLEEPIAGSPAEFERLAASTAIPILLDESARSLDDLRRYAREAPSLAGFVVKTAKNGGPAASLALIRAAADEGLRAMLSSMVETSLGAGSALLLAPLCAWCDLDAPLLLAEDPFGGLGYEDESPRLAPGGVFPGPALAASLTGLEPLKP